MKVIKSNYMESFDSTPYTVQKAKYLVNIFHVVKSFHKIA